MVSVGPVPPYVSYPLIPPACSCTTAERFIEHDIATTGAFHSVHRVSLQDFAGVERLLNRIRDSTTALEDYFYNEIAAIVSNTSYFTTKCSKCIAATGVMHLAAITLPVSTLRTCSSGFVRLAVFGFVKDPRLMKPL